MGWTPEVWMPKICPFCGRPHTSRTVACHRAACREAWRATNKPHKGSGRRRRARGEIDLNGCKVIEYRPMAFAEDITLSRRGGLCVTCDDYDDCLTLAGKIDLYGWMVLEYKENVAHESAGD